MHHKIFFNFFSTLQNCASHSECADHTEQVVGQRGPASCSLLTASGEPMHPNTFIPLSHLERLIDFSNAAIAEKVLILWNFFQSQLTNLKMRLVSLLFSHSSFLTKNVLFHLITHFILLKLLWVTFGCFQKQVNSKAWKYSSLTGRLITGSEENPQRGISKVLWAMTAFLD